MLDFEAARQNPQFAKLWKGEGFVCYWCVPLTVKGEVKGVLEVYCRKAFTPDTEWIEFLEGFAGQAQLQSITLNFSRTCSGPIWTSVWLMMHHRGLVTALICATMKRKGITLRVTELTIKLARAMGLGESQLTAIRRGALLHDIGKWVCPTRSCSRMAN